MRKSAKRNGATPTNPAETVVGVTDSSPVHPATFSQDSQQLSDSAPRRHHDRREYMRRYQNRWMQNRRSQAVAMLGGKCARCGSTDAIEFDHVDPAQKVSTRIWGWSHDRRMAEIAKCQLLCCGCHKAKTAEDRAARIRHPSTTTYRNGCRCDGCRAANRSQKAAHRAMNPRRVDVRKPLGRPRRDGAPPIQRRLGEVRL